MNLKNNLSYVIFAILFSLVLFWDINRNINRNVKSFKQVQSNVINEDKNTNSSLKRNIELRKNRDINIALNNTKFNNKDVIIEHIDEIIQKSKQPINNYDQPLDDIDNTYNTYNIDGDLHVVSVYYSAANSVKAQGGDVTVKVDMSNKPITLLLISYHPVNWIVKTDRNINIKKIYYTGYFKSNIKEKPSDVSVERVIDSRFFHVKEDDVYKIQSFFKKTPKSFQYKYECDFFIVNDKGGNKEGSGMRHNSTETNVEFICRDSNQCSVSPNGLELKYARIGAYSLAGTNKFYSKGKYYLEAEFKNPDNSSVFHTTLGIVSPQATYTTFCYFSTIKNEKCISYEILPFDKKLNNGDVVGVAIDFDRGLLFYSINGEWINASPYQPQSALTFDISNNREYTFAAQISGNSSWKVNFGSEAFRYKVPSGFKPYDTYSADRGY